jgi:ABC-type branched-subunit amino acid transport system ATPase component
VERTGSPYAEGLTAVADAPAPDGAAASLAGENIGVHFEGLRALDGVDVTLARGEVLGLIGPNGAGKTTLINALTGFQPPSTGRLLLDGRDVTRTPAHKLARAGISRTFQSGRSFPDLTVFENVEVGAVGIGVRRQEARRRAREALAELRLLERSDLLAGSLSSGEERRLQVARAVAMRPRYLFLDEPAAGLDENESDELVVAIAGLPERVGCGVLVIEHDMRVIMGLCHRIQVLDHGVTISIGTPQEVRADPAVITAYLGAGRDG